MSPLRHIRTKVLALTQVEMAALVGTRQATISRWENGELQPSLEQMKVIRDEAKRKRKRWDDRWFFEVSA